MAYRLEVFRVTFLQSSKSAVLDCRLMEGRVLIGTAANLNSLVTGKAHPVIVKGPVIGRLKQEDPKTISLVLDLRQDGVSDAAAGDTLVSIELH